MKKMLIAAATLSTLSVGGVAYAQSPQDYTIVPNPPMSASSNDKSRDPGGVTRGSYEEAVGRRSYNQVVGPMEDDRPVRRRHRHYYDY